MFFVSTFRNVSNLIEEVFFADKCRGCCQNISGKVHLVSQVGRFRESRASLSFRQALAAKARDILRTIPSIHAPHQTCSEAPLSDFAAAVPNTPKLPAAIHEALVATGPQAALRTKKPACFLRPAGTAGNYATPWKLKTISDKPPSSFDSEAPGRLTLARMCTQDSVVVGPSLHVPGRSGLYPAKRFGKGEIVCSGKSVDGGWVRVEPGEKKESEFTLRLIVRHM